MATPPVRTEISDTYPNPTNAVARAGFGKLYDYVTGLLGATGNAPEARAAIGAVNIAGDTFTGLVKYKTGTAIASAATINLSTATGNTIHITGVAAISAVTMSNGQVMDVIFDDILTLTHNSTTNKLPSGANITTAAGDSARYFYDGTTVYCLNYSKANGRSLSTQFSEVSAFRTGNQTISTGTWTKVQLNSEQIDTKAEFDSTTNYRFAPLVPGYYLVGGCVGLSASTADGYGGVALYKNGASYKIGSLLSAAVTPNCSVNALVDLSTPGDYIELYAIKSGATSVIAGGSDQTYFYSSLVRAV